MKTKIVTVKYADEFSKKVFSGRAYSYYTIIELKVGDLVLAPTKYGSRVARVSEINVPEESIKHIKNYMKLIGKKINKREYLQNLNVVQEEVKAAWQEKK